MLSGVEDVHRARCNSIIAQSTSVYVMKNPGMGLCECGLGNGQRIESRDSNYKEVGGPYYTDTHLPHPSVCVCVCICPGNTVWTTIQVLETPPLSGVPPYIGEQVLPQ